MLKENQPSVVLFIPETGIYPYLRSLSVLGDALAKKGKKVFITRCSGQLPRCSVMDMYQLPVNISSILIFKVDKLLKL